MVNSFNILRFFITSQALLKSAFGVKKIHADATHKCTWQGFPVLLVGTTDMFRKFHAFGVAVCTHERTADFEFIFESVKSGLADIFNEQMKPDILISDAAGSIHAGFRNVFGEDKAVAMCWYHMRAAVSKKIPTYLRDQNQRFGFMSDVDKLQLSKSHDVFNVAADLFVKKWNPISEDLVHYFTEEWLIKNRYWYEGFSHKTPSTNNALESFNRLIKDEQTLRQRMDLGEFRFAMFKMVQQWSIEYESGLNSINNDGPKVTLEIETIAYQWANSNVAISTKRSKRQVVYRVASRSGNSTLRLEISFVIYRNLVYSTFSDVQCEDLFADRTTLNTWKDFDDFKKKSFSYFDIVFPSPLNKQNWIEGRCDCGRFFKEFICEHVIGLALRLKVTTVRDEAKNIPIGMKRKRGRPAKAKPALVLQD